MTPFIIPIGPPGAGKSTLSHKLCILGVLSQDAVVCPDDYRRILTGDRAHQDANGVVFRICGLIARERLRNSLPVFFDATNLSMKTLREHGDLADELGARAVFVMFHVPLAELKTRNDQRDHPVPADVLERMVAEHNMLRVAKLPGITLTVGECLDWAEQGLLRTTKVSQQGA